MAQCNFFDPFGNPNADKIKSASTTNNMAQQKTADPKLIDSMAMRYRHDFGLLEEPQKESIRTTMKQLWEEVVGLGFYKDEQFGISEHMTQQQTAVEWLISQLYISEDSIWFKEIREQAKEMEKQQIIDAFDNGDNCIDLPDGGFEQKYKSAEQYYTQTYGK
jgi:hypothetical protein